MELDQITDGQIEQLLSSHIVIDEVVAIRIDAVVEAPEPLSNLLAPPPMDVDVSHV